MIIQRWKQCDTYIIGTSHIASNQVCQDRTYSLLKNGVHVIALADGAGSQVHSHEGAELVTQLICEIMVKHFDQYLMMLEKKGIPLITKQNHQRTIKNLVLDQLVEALNKYGIEHNIPFIELSSTLLFLAMKDDFIIYGHIGDGVIGIVKENSKSVDILSIPENGAQPNITFFLTDNDAIDHLRIEGMYSPNTAGVILMSDGTADLLFNKKTGFNENTIKILDNYRLVSQATYRKTLQEFLKQVVSKHSDDDLSINLMYKETIKTNEGIDNAYVDEFLSNVVSKEQIVYVSANAVSIKEPTGKLSNDFQSIEEVKVYLEWR